ncbi:MAG: hypothetical protein M3Z37_07115 [Candidatus Eremiobacteraeota bacterium]|nr:hypothetical protein [Candidatus Eremiobacteraeota bacterium]
MAEITPELLTPVISGEPPAFQHCAYMTRDLGIVQFAHLREPDLSSGFCVDDNARALLAAILVLALRDDCEAARALGEAALRFMEMAQRPDGQYHNLTDADGNFLDDIGSPDCFGRAMWACGVAARCAGSADWRERSKRLLTQSLPQMDSLEFLRPRAYAMLGLAAALDPVKAAPLPPVAGPLDRATGEEAERALRLLAQQLLVDYDAHASADWPWWEDELVWGNARPPEAMLRAAAVLGDAALRQRGMRALEFLAQATQPAAMLTPVGNLGWYPRGGTCAVYDQQPIEACAMTDMWLAAARLTGDATYYRKALDAFSWFLGKNTENIIMADTHTGGCYDGLRQGGHNHNMGAESTLSYVHAHAVVALAAREHEHAR